MELLHLSLRRQLCAGSRACFSARLAGAESLSERRARTEKVETIEVEVACGKLDKENCTIVVPEINSKSVSQGVRLKPLESKDSVESLDVCATATLTSLSCRRMFLPRGS
jgi:hypothetical protein